MSFLDRTHFQIPDDPPEQPSWLAVVLLLVLFWPVGLVLLFKRISRDIKRNELKAYRRYANSIGNRSSVSIRALAAELDMPVENVVNELQSLIDKGYVRGHAHIDRSHMTLYLDGEAVETEFVDRGAPTVNIFINAEDRARTVEEAKSKQRSKGTAKKVEPEDTSPAQEPRRRKQSEKAASPTDSDNFEAKLREIRELNEQIADPVVSERIDRIGELTASIFRVVREKPEHAEEVRRFMNYYLPTTLKLLKSYSLMEKQSYQGENIQASRKKIEDVLDTLIRGFEQQQDRLFSAEAMDVETDISVLETMMASDGLLQKDGGLRAGGK